MQTFVTHFAVLAALAGAVPAPVAAQNHSAVAQAATAKIFHGKGRITGLDARAGQITIAHEAIPGLMDAMEMPFQAKAANSLQGLKVGDAVTFAIDGKTYRLLEIAPAK